MMLNRLSARRLTALFLAVMTLTALMPLSSLAKTEPVVVTLNLSLEENARLARYGIIVYLNDECLGTLDQGACMKKTLEVMPGRYELQFIAGSNLVEPYVCKLSINQSMNVTAVLKTHILYLELRNFTTTPGNQFLPGASGI